MKRVLAMLAVVFGCGAFGGTMAQTAAGPLPALGLGTLQVDSAQASRLFDAVCLQTAPGFTGATDALRGLPFKAHGTTGNFQHTELDLVVTLKTRRCRIGFASTSDPLKLGRVLSTAAIANSDAKVRLIVQDPKTGEARGPGPKGTYFAFWRWENKNGRRTYFAELYRL